MRKAMTLEIDYYDNYPGFRVCSAKNTSRTAC